MCGLVGMIGKIDTQEKKAFKDLLRIDVVRGAHSVGVYQHGPVKQGIIKKALSPDEMFGMKAWDSLYVAGANLLIGHNRYATQGAINSVNAHPFEVGDIIGAHNGTLRNQSLLPDYLDFEVDSENIMHAINKDGVAATIPKLNGAYALTWYNKKDNTFNLVRNAERPLYTCYSEDEKTMFWASEKWMLQAALGRNGIKFTEPASIPIDRHYRVQVPSEYVGQAKKLPLFTVSEVKPYEVPKSNITYYPAKGKKKGNNPKSKVPLLFTGKDKLGMGDTVYFWQGYMSEGGLHMTCPAETDEGYDVRVYFGGAHKSLKIMLTDDEKADCLFEGVICGSHNVLKDQAVIVNPASVKVVSEKKQRELLKGLIV